MKKIVGILSAAAVLAASVFAADVSASAKLNSNLFSYNTSTNELKVFDTISMTGEVDTLKFAVSSDNAGAQFRLRQQEKGTITARSIWFKPIDNLKLSFLENGLSLASDKCHWWDYYKKVNVGAGYGVEYTMDSMSIALNIAPVFVEKSGEADVKFGEIGAKFNYIADFGNIAVIADFKDTFKTMNFGASYANNFNGIDLVVNAGIYLNDGLAGIQGLVYGGYNLDAFSFQVLSNVYYQAKKETENLEVAAVAKVGYQCNQTYSIL